MVLDSLSLSFLVFNDWGCLFFLAFFQGLESKDGLVYGSEETYSRMLGRLGSRPPNCHRKCGRCTPCIATQNPATSDKLGIQYTNYEPEGWKCKCGSTFFNP